MHVFGTRTPFTAVASAMICTCCGVAVTDVYKEFSKGNIRLTRCEHCRRDADKYVESELLLIFLDLMLHRVEAYRHVIFNRLPYRDSGIDGRLLRIYALFMLCDAYMKTVRIGGDAVTMATAGVALLLSVLESWVLVAGIFFAARQAMGHRPGQLSFKHNYLVTAMIVSSFGKLFCAMMVVWDHHVAFSHVITIFTLSSHVAALEAFLNLSFAKTCGVVVAGHLCKVAFQALCHVLFHPLPAMLLS